MKKQKVVHFDEWLDKQPRGTSANIYREHRVSFATMWNARKRIPIKQYDTAKRLSGATGGVVTVKALCEPEPLHVD